MLLAPLTAIHAADSSAQGGGEAKTPNIDAFAKQGFRYAHFYASAPVSAHEELFRKPASG